MNKSRWAAQHFLLASVAVLYFAGSDVAAAQDTDIAKQLQVINAQLKSQEARLEKQERLLKAQQVAIAKQTKVIGIQKKEIRHLKGQNAVEKRPGHMVPAVVNLVSNQPVAKVDTNKPVTETAIRVAEAGTIPTSPVGEAPRREEQAPEVIQSLPEGLAVLTPKNHFILTPSVEYTHTSNDRLVYRGVVVVPGIDLGEVDASSDSRNIVSAVADIRYGITSRLEIEARVPFVWSSDRATVLSQGPQGSATQTLYLQNSGIGDVEVGARYQINRGTEDWPVFVANARVKTDTGTGPFNISRDTSGIAQQVALGSGFLSVEGGLSVLKLTDPAVLFASLNYIYSVPKDINQTIGGVFVGEVKPSNSVSGTLGFGFAVNPDFSFSLGYEHSYVLPQYTMLAGVQQESSSLQAGALALGLAYRVSPKVSLNTNFEFGVTSEAPNLRAVISIPITF